MFMHHLLLHLIRMIKRLSPSVIRILAQNASPFLAAGTNCYLLGSGAKRILVDTGSPGEQSCLAPLQKVLSDEQCTIDKIVVTHWHYDHIGGVKSILDHIDQPESVRLFKHVRVPYRGTQYKDAGEKMPSGINIPKLDEFDWCHLSDGDYVATDGAQIQVVFTPGHADDHISLWMEGENVLFSGDTILGETTCVFDNYIEYMKSLDRLLKLVNGRSVQIFPGHGNEIGDAIERIQFYIHHRKQREEQILQHLCKMIYCDFVKNAWRNPF